MATGALIGGAVISGAGKIKEGNDQKKAADANLDYTRDFADRTYGMISESVGKSREIDEKRKAAEAEADAALGQANKAFLNTASRAAGGAYRNAQISNKEWAEANKQGLGLAMGNIELARQERLEMQGRVQRQNEIDLGRTATARGASGFEGGSSLEMYEQTMESTFASDLAWMQQAGESSESLMEADARLRFQMDESARNERMRGAKLDYEIGMGSAKAKYDYYESQRLADQKLRAADYEQREADRDSMLKNAGIQRDSAIAAAIAGKGAADSAFKSGILGAVGGALGAAGGVRNSYDKFGWGW